MILESCFRAAKPAVKDSHLKAGPGGANNLPGPARGGSNSPRSKDAPVRVATTADHAGRRCKSFPTRARRGQVLPPAWRPVFEARFLQHLNQSEAATQLGMRRTTLAYRELRIRALLRKFLLEEA